MSATCRCRGTQENNDFQTILSSVADGLEQLQQNGVSVILRPWPEMNGGWFPWGTSGMSDSQFVAMWQYTHDYLTNTRGLHNTSTGFGLRMPAFRATCRLVAATLVPRMWISLALTCAPTTRATRRATDPAPDLRKARHPRASSGRAARLLATLIGPKQHSFRKIKSGMPQVVLWQQWVDGPNGNGPGWGMAQSQNIQQALSDPWVLNRGNIGFFNQSTST